jgi:acyl-CoA thioester hydrolase
VQYLSESFHGDTLVFEMTPTDFNRYGCDLVYRVREKTSGRDVARGKTGILFFDYSSKKPVGVPAQFIERSKLP